MRITGWNMFISLLIANVVGGIMGLLHLNIKETWIIGVVVFVIVAIILSVMSHNSEKQKKIENEAHAKIADLENKVAEAFKDK